MRVDAYFDICCDFCSKHLSTDFNTGRFGTPRLAIITAKAIGFETQDGHNICPDCLKHRKELKGNSDYETDV